MTAMEAEDHPSATAAAAVWEDLPDALIERVLSLVPLPRLLQMRAVSKEWSNLILSQGFINLCSAMDQSLSSGDDAPFFLFFTAAGPSGAAVMAAFSPASNRWQPLSLDLIFGIEDEVSVAASGGGLLLLSVGDRIAVCNPLTRSLRLLPEIPSCSLPLLSSIQTDPSGGGYKVLVAGPGGWSDQRTFVFDSRSGVWSRRGDLPSEILDLESEGVLSGGSLFVACSIPRDRVVAFDFSSGEWSKTHIDLPAGVTSPNLVLCRGEEIHLVAAVGGDETPPTSIRIWRMGRDKKSWEEVAEMPAEMSGCFFSDGRDSTFRCVGRGQWIFVVRYDGEVGCAVDVVAREWRWLPSCKGVVEGRCCVEGLFVAEPALGIPV